MSNPLQHEARASRSTRRLFARNLGVFWPAASLPRQSGCAGFSDSSWSKRWKADRGDLKEYRLGLAVFDRPESFDPGADPIVRVEARRVRTKLAKYYESEGRHDDVVIELPKGGYVPTFHRREPGDAELHASATKRLAVLPFVDLSAGFGATCLGDGLTWELIHGLTRIESLSVVAWNSAAQLRSDGIPEIALIREKLQVQAVLAGSIRRFRRPIAGRSSDDRHCFRCLFMVGDV